MFYEDYYKLYYNISNHTYKKTATYKNYKLLFCVI
uniref:Uncharacterized protein n=1 Tax=Platysiphonia delicata TaxID=2006979 RepID=A0A1Z1M186_9FLOR|nr:hypothetical protein [Platysiphonia delicata]ARW59545.1 hypothetical protein [Platysiphonia delicata]